MDKSLLTLLLVLGAATLVLFNLEGSSPQPYSFEQYKADYGKKYRDAGEEQYRKTIFLRNLVKIESHNVNPSKSYTQGVNQFTDLLDEEFKAIYLTLQVPETKNIILLGEETPIVGDVDWEKQGVVTPVKNQGQCGSCWAFSATAALESAYKLKDHELPVSLSEQELVDCSRAQGNQGCNGGWMDSAFTYIKSNKIHSDKDYPYVARDQACKASTTSGQTWTVTGFVDVPGCTELANALEHRPISVAVDASVWSSYRSGVLSNCGLNVNHGVLLIGSNEQYWRIKNSWGATWGESGFIRLARGNTCAICQYPSYPTI